MNYSVNQIGIAGAGLMGCSIAAAFLRAEIPVLLYDFAAEARDAAPERIAEELACQLPAEDQTTGKPREEARERTARLLSITGELAGLNSPDIILETIVEKSKIKQKFYRDLSKLCRTPKLLLSNTSTIQITELAGGLSKDAPLAPDRFCGFHFFHPVRKRSLIEIIRGAETSSETLEKCSQLALQIEKEPILAADGPGFLVNRLLNPYLEEAMTLLLEGVPFERIENACRNFGMEMGPFRIMDEIGLDVTFHSGWTFFKAFPQFIRSGELLPAMIESGRLGRKNGHGFKIYQEKGNWSDNGYPDPELIPLLQKISCWKESDLLLSASDSIFGERRRLNGPLIDDEILLFRVFCAVLAEAERIIQAGIVSRTSEVDRALTRGLGFPKEKGGIFPWSQSVGRTRIEKICREFELLNPKFKLTFPDLP